MKKLIGLIAALMLTEGVAQAANMWDGGGADGSWLTTTNWDNNLNPAAYVAVTFNTSVIGQTNTFLGGGRSLNQLIFNADADSNLGIELATTAGGTGAANLYLYGTDAGGAPKITVDSNATANIRIFGAPAASVVGLLVRTGNTASGNLTIDHNGSGDLSIEKGITGAGYSVTKTGTGTLTLANGGAASTYNNFTLNDGRVRIGGAQVATALGTNTVYLNGGTLSSDGATARSTAQALVFGGNVKLGHATDNGALTLNGATDLGGATNTITADSAVTLGGVISNGGLTKDGTGTMTLTNANTYAGVTTVKTGVLNIRNASALGTTAGNTVVESGGSLQLQGSITVAENINIAGSGATGSAGALRNVSTSANTVSGLLTLDANASIAGGNTLTLTGGVVNNHALTHSGTELVIDCVISGTGTITKAIASGSSGLTLKGLNTYTGDTAINATNMLLADNAGLTFVIGTNGVNNKLTGIGSATLDGDFYFDLTGAGTTVGDSWTIANVSNQTFSATFTVNGFTDAGSDKWTKTIAGSTYYEFSESSGVLQVIGPSTYALTVNSGSGSGSYTNGHQVAIEASVISGKTFVQWTGDTAYLDNSNSASATVTMPAQAVSVTATYVDNLYALTVNSGSGSGSYTNGHQVMITANAPASGYAFTFWTGDTAYLIDSNSASTTVTMPMQAVSVTATYIATEQYTSNGTPYSWLASYGLTNYVADDLLDQDSDGLKTWQEYIAGTVPTDAASVLKAAQAVRNVVTWNSVTGRVYSVYWSTNLVKGFTVLSTNIVHPQGCYTNTTPDAKYNYYQVRVRKE